MHYGKPNKKRTLVGGRDAPRGILLFMNRKVRNSDQIANKTACRCVSISSGVEIRALDGYFVLELFKE